MIPNAEFERALTQWKIRRQGGQVATQAGEAASGAVVGEMALANAEPGLGDVASGETHSGPTPGDYDPET
ncbi:MAG TPA: hypothetical protein VJ801_04235 [Polyangia bacterium]|jgi:hypothetical protein|nr:hypothetical protein [Polyangia bacterium]